MDMDYETIDRAASRAVLMCIRNGTRLYVADNASETATDILGRAKVYRDRTDAALQGLRLSKEFGFTFEPECLIVAEAEDCGNGHPDTWEPV
jgi:hypothetical protein